MFHPRSNDYIKVCRCDEKTPLLWTFKFNGTEYWCPKCGYMSGMFGAGMDIPKTPELELAKQAWEERATPYLRDETEEWVYGQDSSSPISNS